MGRQRGGAADRLCLGRQLGARGLGLRLDDDLRRLAEERLSGKAATYSDIADGAAYISRYPTGTYVEAVTLRLNALAEGLFGELLLYQSVGDQLKAMDRIQRILTHAPLSPAASRLMAKVTLPA